MERNNIALVIGGGLAGPLVALSLRRLGMDVTVFDERSATAASTEGAWLTLAVNGLDAMATLGVDREVLAAGFPSRTVELVSGSGAVLGSVPLGGELDGGIVTHTLKRSALRETLVRAAERAGARFEHDKRFASLEESEREVVARFEDGTEARGALLVGADGIWSKVRAAIDPDAPRPRYNGLGNVGGFTPRGRVDLAPGAYRMVFGSRAFFGYTVAPGGDVWWFANPPRAQPLGPSAQRAGSDAALRDELVALFAGDVGPMEALVRGADGALTITDQHDLPRVSRWSRGRVVIVGDAAHAAAPSSGQGVSMAAEDAVELGRCFRDLPDLAGALRTFESVRRARAHAVVAHGARSSNTKTLGPVGVWMRDRILPFVLRRIAADDGRSLAWLYRHHIDWDARVVTRSRA